MLNWVSKLDSIIKERKTVLCVGLDPQDSLVKELGFDSSISARASMLSMTIFFILGGWFLSHSKKTSN